MSFRLLGRPEVRRLTYSDTALNGWGCVLCGLGGYGIAKSTSELGMWLSLLSMALGMTLSWVSLLRVAQRPSGSR